ncbi:heat shock protein HSP42 KNAG_0A04870 [Huiozyma naganishii CBS 8797]|uniref:SHSP domain-containing protein n=1 Tax=Huiozyma naganishii (strain ATCC MYA-139 / BCRC 22969 / CBS 8797 / KCTC 17520 / NBRC 10181 / NCYC 3082 / Yp74L-3) TaxID=1071383 RepID=J7RTR9_HUIN7|nr:hypothetical protein KNAG_0A04870 [Kazachstania naganishii CBS 8797]CCK68157.1 hypothetical protein KNAG_0A04870 [Kazachstania naganishii CBS 8797]
MSFYQPSLSLYDVLNALSDQSRQRDPQQRVQQGRTQAHPHRHAHPRVVHGYGPHTHGHVRGRPQFGGPPSQFGPAGYFYRMPGQGYYYNPEYGYYEDDDDASDAGVTNVAGIGGVQDDEQDQDMRESERPSYYHLPRQAERRGYEPAGSDFLADLLNAFAGAAPATTGEEESSGEQPAEEAAEEETERSGAEATEGSGAEATDKQGETQGDKVASEEEGPFKKGTGGEYEIKKPIKEAVRPNLPKIGRKNSGFAHLQAPSPRPDPLQISKPETRLDLPFSPEINVYDLDDKYVVVLALPGANSKSFKIDYHPSSHELLIKGNIIDRLGIEEKFLTITEIKYGAFERTVKFPVLPRIKDEEIKATYSNGLLQIKVPKIADPQDKPQPKKRITIEDVPDEELEFEKNPNPVQPI